MPDTDFFLSTNPAEPWAAYPFGPPALAAVAVGLVALTLWTYVGHPQVTGRRLGIVLGLRLAALAVALLTAVRPSVGVQDDPKVPSTLVVGIDLSESMTVPDELNNQPRIAAVRKTLEKCQPVLDLLKSEHNVDVVMYGFGTPDFSPAANAYDPKAPAAFKASDYATYLNRTFTRWQADRFVRGHLVVGDGQANGPGSPARDAERWAGEWKRAGRPVHTFGVGQTDSTDQSKDVAIRSARVQSAEADGSVYIKTDFVLRLLVSAFGFKGATVPVRVQFDEGDGYKDVATETRTLNDEAENDLELTLKAPERAGEIKIRVEIPVDSVPGDVAPSNNVIETYLTVSKKGMRVLLVGRLGFEEAAVRRALLADPRIDLYQVLRQPDAPVTPDQRQDFDFDARAYDAIVIGNVSAKQLTDIDPQLPRKLAEQVLVKGTGLLMTGGHATFLGTPDRPDATGWRGVREIEDVLPVDLGAAPPVPGVYDDKGARFQFVPTGTHYLTRLADSEAASATEWLRLNTVPRGQAGSRFTGLSRVGAAKPTATVYAVASPERVELPVPLKQGEDRKLAPALVGHQIGAGQRGRVLVLAAEDTYLWQKLGLPDDPAGIRAHSRFWRQLVRWLSHQEQEEGQVYATPDERRLPVAGRQVIRVGVRQPTGAPALDPKLEVKVVAPGENPAGAKSRPVVPDPDQPGRYRVAYEPTAAGEYVVLVKGSGKTAAGAEVSGEATARFLAYPEASDEMLRKAADHDFLRKVATAGGGQFRRLEELPGFLKEIGTQPMESAKPRPKFYPNWERNESKGFLPAWVVLFAALLGAEWGLRRVWGLV